MSGGIRVVSLFPFHIVRATSSYSLVHVRLGIRFSLLVSKFFCVGFFGGVVECLACTLWFFYLVLLLRGVALSGVCG